jgi:hypothetical protein
MPLSALITLKSHAKAKAAPTPAAVPFIAPIIGFLRLKKLFKIGL